MSFKIYLSMKSYYSWFSSDSLDINTLIKVWKRSLLRHSCVNNWTWIQNIIDCQISQRKHLKRQRYIAINPGQVDQCRSLWGGRVKENCWFQTTGSLCAKSFCNLKQIRIIVGFSQWHSISFDTNGCFCALCKNTVIPTFSNLNQSHKRILPLPSCEIKLQLLKWTLGHCRYCRDDWLPQLVELISISQSIQKYPYWPKAKHVK